MDNESSIDILFYSTFSQMCLPTNRLWKILMSLVNFTGDAINVEEEIILSLTVGTKSQQSTILATFMVVQVSRPTMPYSNDPFSMH